MKKANRLNSTPINLKDENGAALVEELVTIAIIGMGIVILVAMITTGTLGVRRIDDDVRGQTLARSQLELIKNAPYESDPLTSPYPSVAGLAGYTVTVTIDFWNAGTSSFQSGWRDDGLQRITVSVSSGTGLLTEISEYKLDR